MAQSKLDPTVLASIIAVSGQWSLTMATKHQQPNPKAGELILDLAEDFNEAFKYLESYVDVYYQRSEDNEL